MLAVEPVLLMSELSEGNAKRRLDSGEDISWSSMGLISSCGIIDSGDSGMGGGLSSFAAFRRGDRAGKEGGMDQWLGRLVVLDGNRSGLIVERVGGADAGTLESAQSDVLYVIQVSRSH